MADHTESRGSKLDNSANYGRYSKSKCRSKYVLRISGGEVERVRRLLGSVCWTHVEGVSDLFREGGGGR